jgi:rSAM/selenodomain-associated transferase 2
MRLAVIVPVLNEERAIADTLARLAPLRARGAVVVAVDGGSTDRTVERARAAADHVLLAPRGRALQMNAGARHALADPAIDTLLFLHADTRLPDDADREVRAACAGRPSAWGRFDVRIEGASPTLRLVAAMMNLRSRATGICTGDQCLFATRALFEALDGYAELPLMEDIEFSRRARRVAWPIAIRARVTTSGRRWERHGVVRTVLLMWRLRLAYFLGADPARLAAAYRDAR